MGRAERDQQLRQQPDLCRPWVGGLSFSCLAVAYWVWATWFLFGWPTEVWLCCLGLITYGRLRVLPAIATYSSPNRHVPTHVFLLLVLSGQMPCRRPCCSVGATVECQESLCRSAAEHQEHLMSLIEAQDSHGPTATQSWTLQQHSHGPYSNTVMGLQQHSHGPIASLLIKMLAQ